MFSTLAAKGKPDPFPSFSTGRTTFSRTVEETVDCHGIAVIHVINRHPLPPHLFSSILLF
jgi:hypothetical protein